MLVFAMALIGMLYCGFFYWLRGNADFSSQLRRVAFCFVLVYFASPESNIQAILTILACWLATILGHGQYMTLNFYNHKWPKSDEKLDFVLVPFFGKDPRIGKSINAGIVNAYGNKKLYYRCLAGLFVKSALISVPLCLLNPLAALGALAMPIAYALSWKLIPDFQGKFFNATQLAEFLFGALIGLIVCI